MTNVFRFPDGAPLYYTFFGWQPLLPPSEDWMRVLRSLREEE